MPANFIRDGKLDLEPLIAELDRFLKLVVKNTGFELKYEISREPAAEPSPETDTDVTVVFRGPDDSVLLAHNAELLHSIEYIALRWLHLEPRFFDHVRLDCANYRADRLEELKLTAKVAAQRVRETRQPIRLNPMSARERRVVHLSLQGADGVRTGSEGAGDHRSVVIHPTDKK